MRFHRRGPIPRQPVPRRRMARRPVDGDPQAAVDSPTGQRAEATNRRASTAWDTHPEPAAAGTAYPALNDGARAAQIPVIEHLEPAGPLGRVLSSQEAHRASAKPNGSGGMLGLWARQHSALRRCAGLMGCDARDAAPATSPGRRVGGGAGSVGCRFGGAPARRCTRRSCLRAPG